MQKPVRRILAVMCLAVAAGVTFARQDVDLKIFVRDSAVAAEKIALAERMARLEQWDTSATVYQEIIDEFADRVLPAEFDSAGRPTVYRSVAPEIQDRIAAWPAAGLAVYRSLFEPAARQELEAAGDDPRLLQLVATRFFATESGRAAAVRIFDLRFSRGEFSSAAIIAQRVIERHPAPDDKSPLLIARAALAWQLAGNPTRARQLLDRLETDDADATATIAGEPVKLTDWLAKALESVASAGRPSPGGVPDDSLGPPAAQRIPVARHFVAPRPASPDAENPREAFTSGLPRTASILPEIDGDELFFQDNSRVYGLSLSSGQPLPGWLAAGGSAVARSGQSADLGTTPRGVVVGPDVVVAFLNQPDLYLSALQQMPVRPATVSIIDRATGQERWAYSIDQDKTLPESVQATVPVGTPLFAGDSIYFMTRGGRSRQFDDVYLVCLDLVNQKSRWARHLVSGSSPAAMMEAGGGTAFISPSKLSAVDGRVFVCTDLGAVAAVNAADGTIEWLSAYPRKLPEARRPRRAIPERMPVPPAFVHNPVLVEGGRVYVLPGDTPRLFIFDATDGTLLRDIDLESLDRDSTIWMLLGVIDQKFIVSSNNQVFCIDGARYQPGLDPLRFLCWKQTTQGGGDWPIPGRPMVTRQRVYIPTATEIRVVDMRTGRIEGLYPGQRAEWGENEGPGNLLVASGALVVAGSDRVNVYLDIGALRNRLDAEIAASPDAVGPRIRYASALVSMGEPEAAVAQLDEAIERVTLSPTPVDDATRIFQTAATFIRETADPDQPPTPITRLLLAQLRRVATTPPQTAAARLTEARIESSYLPADALAAAQGVLDDDALSDVAVRSVDGGESTAAEVASAIVRQVVQQHGRAVYSETEIRANAAFTAAREAGDADALLRLARAYSGASGARDAVVRAAELFDEAGRHSDAINARRQLLQSADSLVERANLRVQIAAGLAADRSTLPAAVGLLRAALAIDSNASLPKPLKIGHTEIPAGPVRDAIGPLQAILREEQFAALPDFQFDPEVGRAIDARRVVAVDGITRIIPTTGNARGRVAAVDAGGSVRIFLFGESEAMPVSTRAADADVRGVWTADRLLLLDSDTVAAIDPKSAALLWERPRAELDGDAGAKTLLIDDGRVFSPGVIPPRVDRMSNSITMRNVVDRNRLGNVRRLQLGNGIQQPDLTQTKSRSPPVPVLAGECLIVAGDDGGISAVRIHDGSTLWSRRIGSAAPVGVGAAAGSVAAAVVDADGSRLVILDLRTGRPRAIHTLASSKFAAMPNNRIRATAFSESGLAVALLGDRVYAVDLAGDPAVKRFETTINSAIDGEVAININARPSHVQIESDRVCVLVDAMTELQRIVLLDAQTGRPVVWDQPVELSPEAPVMAVDLAAAGGRLYAWSAVSLLSFDLSGKSPEWRRVPTRDGREIVGDVRIGRGELLAMTAAVPAGRRPVHGVPRLEVFSRKRFGDVESGVLIDDVELQPLLGDVNNVQAEWAAVDGGACVVAEGRLVFLPGDGQ